MQSLNDVYPAGDVEIWYATSPDWSLLLVGDHVPSINSLAQSHTLVGRICRQSNLEKVFEMMQGENWSPNGEARDFIRKLGLWHTSMSVGDVIKIQNEAWLVQPIGFLELTNGHRCLL